MGQVELQRLYASPHGFIGTLENARQEPELLTLIRLAGCLDTSVDEFFVDSAPDVPGEWHPNGRSEGTRSPA
jgi:hypothetical protein